MGVRVSRAEKLDFCLQALDKLYKQLDKHFDTFMGYDIQFSAEGNFLYNVEFSNMERWRRCAVRHQRMVPPYCLS